MNALSRGIARLQLFKNAVRRSPTQVMAAKMSDVTVVDDKIEVKEFDWSKVKVDPTKYGLDSIEIQCDSGPPDLSGLDPMDEAWYWAKWSAVGYVLVGITFVYQYLDDSHGVRYEFHPYSHIRRRRHKYPWGYDTTLFHNSIVNPTQDGFLELTERDKRRFADFVHHADDDHVEPDF